MNTHRLLRRAAAVATACLATLAAATLTAGTARATTPPTLLLPNMVITEGNAGKAPFVVNVGLSAPNPFDHAVTVEVVDFTAIPLPDGTGTYGTATPGQDYVGFAPFRLTFQPGQQVARFAIRLKGDGVPEGNEEIDVRFDDTVFTVGDNDIDLVIADDDTSPLRQPKPALLLPNQVMPEPTTGCFAYQVSVLLDRPATVPSSVDAVDFSAVPLPPPATGTYGTATPGVDYVGFGTRTLNFAKGSRSGRLPITICGDTTSEGSEEIDVRFDNTTTIAIGDNDIDLVLAD